MITLDLDLSYLNSYYHIGTTALEQYRNHNKSIAEVMEAEAAKGNTKAAEFLMKAASDPQELTKVFQLANPKNRYLILKNMNKEDLMKVMERLDTDQFILGLSIFTKDAICQLMYEMEPEALSKMILKNMGAEKFLKMIPEKFMDQFLSSDKLDRKTLSKAMENVDEEQLQKMMENITGQSCYDDKESILKQMDSLDDEHFKKALFAFDVQGKQQLIGNVIKEKPELFEEFSPEAMVYPFMQMEKEDILKCMQVLEPDDFMPMMEELPQEFMALIATQVKPQDLAEILCTDFKDIISQCAIG